MAALITRRAFLARSGAAAGAVTLGAYAAGFPASAHSAGRLRSRHRATYEALVGATAAAVSPHVTDAYSESAAERFAGWYEGSAAQVRRAVDALLDGVERSSPRRFARLSRAQRLRLLREWRESSDPDRRALSVEAVGLASPPFGTGGGEIRSMPLMV